MLKTLRSTKSTIRLGEGRVGVAGTSRTECNGKKIGGSEIDGCEVRKNEVEKKSQKKSMSKKSSKSKIIIESLDFFTPGAKLAFTKLRQVFIKALILHHFDVKYHI